MQMRYLFVVPMLALSLQGQVMCDKAQLCLPTSGGTPTITKIGSLNFATASPYTVSVTGNAAAGDTVMVACWGHATNGGTHYNFSVSDSVSNTWTFTNGTTNTNLQYLDTGDTTAIQTPYAANIATGYTSGSTTLTVTTSVADGSTGGCDVLDIKGLLSSPLDQIAGAVAAFSTTQTSATITPSQQPEVAIGIFAIGNTDTPTVGNIMGSAATSVDIRTGGSTGNPKIGLIEWRRITSTSAGPATATLSSNSDGWGSVFLSN
jgi:hypothetical protein